VKVRGELGADNANLDFVVHESRSFLPSGHNCVKNRLIKGAFIGVFVPTSK